MDRALKERIIGAIVLVAVVVLVVPVFLDGPPGSDEVVTERVPLPGQSEQKMQTIVLDRDRTEPVPAAASETPTPVAETPRDDATRPAERESAPAQEPESAPPQEQAQETQQQPEVEQPPEPEQQAEAAPATTSSTGMFAVQLGSFSNQENAERLAADLRQQGFAAFLSQLSTGNGALHRVRIGPQGDRAAAEAMAERLAAAGHQGQVVPHP